MTELKPCPFCGKSVATVLEEPGSQERYIAMCVYYRDGCGASAGFRETKEEAINAWNRRENSE